MPDGLTTTSGYLRMFIFGYCVEPAQISTLQRMVSFIVCVYLPAFLAIHLKSSAAEGPSVVLFTRDLLLAYKLICQFSRRFGSISFSMHRNG